LVLQLEHFLLDRNPTSPDSIQHTNKKISYGGDNNEVSGSFQVCNYEARNPC